MKGSLGTARGAMMAAALLGASATVPAAAPAKRLYHPGEKPQRRRGVLATLMSPTKYATEYHTSPNGTVLSRKRDVRRALMAEHGITTGRQWVRLRKRLSRQERGVS